MTPLCCCIASYPIVQYHSFIMISWHPETRSWYSVLAHNCSQAYPFGRDQCARWNYRTSGAWLWLAFDWDTNFPAIRQLLIFDIFLIITVAIHDLQSATLRIIMSENRISGTESHDWVILAITRGPANNHPSWCVCVVEKARNRCTSSESRMWFGDGAYRLDCVAFNFSGQSIENTPR